MDVDVRGLRPGRYRMACSNCAKGRRDDALSVLVRDDGSAVWNCFRCGSIGGTRRGREYRAIVSAAPRPAPDAQRAPSARRIAARIWKECSPLADTLGAAYLRDRCCDLPPADGDLRFHPALWCPETKCELPALVARVSTVVGNRGVGVHRIWFRPGETRAVKKMRLGGCDNPVCVRLWPDATIETALGIAEGVETALAAATRFRPMWSTIDAGQMTRFPLLDRVASLTIFADFDDAGMKAANAAQWRYFNVGRTAQIVRSRIPHEDYNDVVRKAQHA